MPQEFHVIRCYSCETFQVHIVKKSNKWDCKMCGEKQSIKKVYFQGSGKDCRLNVQKLNEKRILNDLKTDIPENPVIDEFENQNENCIQEVNQNSKWEEFLPTNRESSEDEVEQSIYTFNRPNKRKSFTKKTNENKKIKLKSEELADKDDQIENTGTSTWKNFISNIANNSENVLKEASNCKPELLANDENSKKSKWDCFVDNESEDDNEIPDQGETNVSLNRDSKQSSSNIFSSDDNNLDDILKL